MSLVINKMEIFFTLNGKFKARDLSTAIARMVRMDAWAIVCSSIGITLHRTSPKYQTSFANRSTTALGIHTMIRSKSATLRFTRNRLVLWLRLLFHHTTQMTKAFPKKPIRNTIEYPTKLRTMVFK